MTFSELKDKFYQSMYSELFAFSKTNNNKDIYSLVFDCESDIAQICLRYGNEAHYAKISKDFEKYADLYNGKRNGLHGQKYSVGEFPFIGSVEYNGYVFLQFDEQTEHFLKSCYYHNIGEYYGEGDPIEQLDSGEVLNETTVKELFYEMIIDCIERLKQNIGFLNITQDFIFYMCDSTYSSLENEELMKKTVDSDILDKLNNIA